MVLVRLMFRLRLNAPVATKCNLCDLQHSLARV